MDIDQVVSTELFVGSERHPLQVQRVTLTNRGAESVREGEPVTVRIEGAGVTTPRPVVVPGPRPGEERVVDVPVAVGPGPEEGTRLDVTVSAEAAGRRREVTAELVVAAPGWTMFMVPHFHYDPFWWNTQAGYLSEWDAQPAEAQKLRKPHQAAAFDLVRAHLDFARRDPDYKFVLAEFDYLKPYWDVCPEDRADLRRFIAEGRIELVGGMYNEPNTNLTSLEATIRNIAHGVRFQRGLIGGEPRTGWMLDVFGHDPAFPSLMADAGLTELTFARGPFHQWGPQVTGGDDTGMQFASEIEWIGPDGTGLPACYLAHHYPAGWRINEVDTLAEAEEEAYHQFRTLKRVASTRNVLLPVGYNHVAAGRWTTEIHRHWNERYVWPRFVVALPGEFFARVREDADRDRIAFTPQSRDMNPVYPGKDVSYIDIKQAQRAAETAVLDAEKLSTLATLLGAPYPEGDIDKAWRQLFFGAHHDGITGVTSDQVYLDLAAGWREAYELGAGARDEALAYLAGRTDTRGVGRPLLVVNTQSWERTDLATVTVDLPEDGPAGVRVLDGEGREVPAVATGVSRHPGGALATVTLSFVAEGVPATGHRVFRLVDAAAPAEEGWRRTEGYRAENDAFLVEADPARGGALTRVLDKRTGKELLRPGEAAGPVLDDEYPDHPAFGKGPWHIVPTGHRRTPSEAPAEVHVETSPAGLRLVSACRIEDLRITTEVTLFHGLDRLEFRTRIDGASGQDRLLRVRFPLDIAGARPVYEVGNAVIGRTFGSSRLDVAEHPYALDSPAYNWAGLSSAARVVIENHGVPVATQAIGVAEVVARHGRGEDQDAAVRALVAALAQQGVTATTSRPEGSRYGSLDVDSNLPDVRLSIGGPAENAFTARVLAAAGDWYTARLDALLKEHGTACLWVPATRSRTEMWAPGTDLRGPRDLPVLVVAGHDGPALAGAVTDLAAGLSGAEIRIEQPGAPDAVPADEMLEDHSAAVLHRGTPGFVVEPDGTLCLSLLRACSGWPAGTWIEPPQRTAPDGSSFALQHWSHTFAYALVSGAGDWRDAGFVRAGHAYNSRFLTRLTDTHDGELPASVSLLRAEPDNVVVTALKPRHGEPGTGITLRCYETHGRATRARVHSFVPLHDGAEADLHERPRAPLDTDDGTLRLALGPAATVTATAVPDAPVPRPTGPGTGPEQPVYARYWLHNKGAAPLGHQPATVYVEPRNIDLTGPVSVRVTVSAVGRASGTVELAVPQGVTASAPDDLRFDLDDDHRCFDVLLRPEEGAPPGIRHLTARLAGEDCPPVEDVATVRMGATGGEGRLTVETVTPELVVDAGGKGELRVRLTNHSLDEVRGEAQLITPYGTWEFAGPWTSTFALGAGARTVLAYPVRVPHGTAPAASWALVKVMAYGDVHYTPTVPLTVRAHEPARPSNHEPLSTGA